MALVNLWSPHPRPSLCARRPILWYLVNFQCMFQQHLGWDMSYRPFINDELFQLNKQFIRLQPLVKPDFAHLLGRRDRCCSPSALPRAVPPRRRAKAAATRRRWHLHRCLMPCWMWWLLLGRPVADHVLDAQRQFEEYGADLLAGWKTETWKLTLRLVADWVVSAALCFAARWKVGSGSGAHL